jgi:hypothetical protein
MMITHLERRSLNRARLRMVPQRIRFDSLSNYTITLSLDGFVWFTIFDMLETEITINEKLGGLVLSGTKTDERK